MLDKAEDVFWPNIPGSYRFRETAIVEQSQGPCERIPKVHSVASFLSVLQTLRFFAGRSDFEPRMASTYK